MKAKVALVGTRPETIMEDYRRVMELADYPALLAEQAERRDDPSRPLMGLGWCAYVEIANPMQNGEFGSIRVQPDGSAIVLTGSSAHGQGHHTAFAQVASDLTGRGRGLP